MATAIDDASEHTRSRLTLLSSLGRVAGAVSVRQQPIDVYPSILLGLGPLCLAHTPLRSRLKTLPSSSFPSDSVACTGPSRRHLSSVCHAPMIPRNASHSSLGIM